MSRIAEKPTLVPVPAPARGDVVALTLTKTVSTLLDRAIANARDAMIGRQSEEGYWLFELEADCTIPAEYIMMMHFLDEIDESIILAACEPPRGKPRQAHDRAGAGSQPPRGVRDRFAFALDERRPQVRRRERLLEARHAMR